MQTHQAPPSPRLDVPSSFRIPSIHDGIELECRTQHPKKIKSSRGAIVAHPYGPLGGSFDDLVVQTTANTFVSEGYIVGTFNFRGVGASKGRTSWSSKPEIADYASFIGFFLLYLSYFQDDASQVSSTGREGKGADSQPGLKNPQAKLKLVLGGYSYGAMLTIELPSIESIIGRFKDASNGSIESKLEEQAHCQAERQRTTVSSQPAKIDDIRSFIPTVSYVLISPLLPPLSWAIAMPLPKFSFRPHHGHDSDTASAGATPWSKKLYQCPTLAVYSDNDQFTGIKKLQKWSADLQNHDKSQFRCFEVAGAGHFWHKEGALEEVQSRLQEWLRS